MGETLSRSARYKRDHPEKAREYARSDNARPGRNAQKREWDREVYMRPCPGCGTMIMRDHPRCASCRDARRRTDREALLDRVERMWNDGMLGREIAVALGRKPLKDGASPEINELRRRGRIGYRYKAYEGRSNN